MLFSEPFSDLSIFDKSATIAFFLTLAMILCIIIIASIVKKKKPEMMKPFLNTVTGVIVGYSVGIVSILLFLKLDAYIVKDYVDKITFIPVLILLITTIVLSLIGLIISIFKAEKFKNYSIFAISIVVIFLAVLLIVNIAKNGSEIDKKSATGLYLYSLLIVVAITVLTFTVGKKSDTNNTKSIVYAAVCIAMSFALSYLRFLELPQGGSITFASLLPLMVYSYMFGIRKGVVAGVIYGLLQFIQGPWFLHPVQFLLDYPIAFGAIGLTGILKERNVLDNKKVLQFAIGATIAVLFRYFSHVISGIFVFGSADPENYGAIAWSFLYNAFTLADLAIDLVAGCIMFASKSFLRLIDPERIK